MKTRNGILILLVTLGFVTLVSFQNCSKTSFTQSSGAAVVGGSTSDTPPSTPPVGTDNQDVPVESTNSVPKYKVYIDPCNAGEYCKVNVVLNQVARADYKFDWVTNDTRYLSDPQKYAKPNFHYVPTGGLAVIRAGQQKVILQIKSINWTFTGAKDSILIPLSFSNCNYDGNFYSCLSLRDQ